MSKRIKWQFSIWSVLLMMGTCLTSCKPDHQYYSFKFYYSSLFTGDIYLDSVRVLSRNVQTGVRSNSPHRSSILYGRDDCTPTALINTTANFAWWEKRFTNPDSKTAAPLKPEQRLTCSLPFPEFDLKQGWICHYTLQRDNTWVGKFHGTKAKPIGADPVSHKNRKLPQQQWLEVYFQNQTQKEIWFSAQEVKLITPNAQTPLFLENIPADGLFHGFAAHSHEGSIYRPGADSKIVGTWGHRGEQGQQPFEFTLPKFSSEAKNWYCYFTLNKDENWTTVFEGTYERKTDLDQ